MTSILTVFSDKENVKSNKKKLSSFPSLNQGKKFKKYQNKIEDSLEKNAEFLSGKEGFIDMEGKKLTNGTRHIINNNNYSNQQQIIDNLRQEHEKTLQEYNTLATQMSSQLNGYVNRVSQNNPYLNKVVSFTTGEICYVTNQGVVKWIASMDILKTLNISQKTQVKLNIPWTTNYNTPGTQIPTTPPLVSGTPLVSGQSLGNEGSNVFVNQLLPDVKPKYMDCYAANSNNDNMTFIGGSPPSLTDVSIQNGNFSQPQIENNSYQYIIWNSSIVPGWNFDCVLLNNSTAWGYPIPYPNGNQCACIQQSQQLWTNIWIPFVAGTTYTLSFSACGRNCCDGSGKANPINIGLEGTTFYTLNAVVGEWQTYTTTFTPQTTGGQRISFIGNWTTSDRSTAIQNIKLNVSGSSDNGSYSYDSCKQAAINNDYRYFGLQNVNPSTGQGYCAVSNSEPSVKQYGVSKVPNKMVALWSSNTAGQTGNTATLTNTGSLQVINSSGQAVYSSPASSAKPSNYLGCYGDKSKRAMTAYNNGQQLYSNSQCQQIAQQNGYQYYGLQNSTSGTNAQCMVSNNESQSLQYGKATNCTKVSDGSWSGGGWSNAVYSTTLPESNYYLILQNNGNMCIYRGTRPSDNQGGIWCTSTSGKQQSPNPNMVSKNGKYGQSWMTGGSTLAPGDFIGSDDGKLALVMQSDGNLVLYTYQMETNCQKMSDGKMGGGIGANAVYDIGMNAVSSNMGNLGFVDADSNLYTYPNENQSYTNKYTTIKNVTTDGNDIAGASFGNATIKSCESSCNNNSECAGFVFDNSNKICYPKNGDMYPYGGDSSVLSNVDIHIRGKQPTTPPLGVSQNTNNTNSITYQNYVNKGNIGSQYGLANATSSQKQQLTQLQTKLNLLSSQITNLTNNFQDGTYSAEKQSKENITGINDYLTDLNNTNTKTKAVAGETSGNIQNILKDSDIVVLQKNYDYLFWSILAAGTVLVSMNIVKK
jgi:hypothetical protein